METDPKTATQTTLEERRREPRYSAEGRAVMVIEAGRRLEIVGSLVDMSDHGLCIAHMYPALASGMEIEVHFNEQVRKARVMWNRINADGVQSGFYLP
jgi:hypothetical protein